MRKKILKLNVDEHAALCELVKERVRDCEAIESIENSKILENSAYFTSVALGASRKARVFRLAYQSLLDSLSCYDECEDDNA